MLWNDNDGGCKGACDRVPHQNVTDLKLTGQCIDGECYDDVLFHNLDSYIDNLQQDGIIVLHTIGSHGPTYYNRYPAAFRKFTPTCDTNEIQGCTREQLTNTYDNTILYVDYVVDKAIKLLQSKQDKFTTSPRFICPTTANRWEKMASICMVYRIPSRRIRRNMCRWRCGSPPTTSSATAFPRTVCSSGRKKRITRRIICSPPCSACSASAPASTGRQMIS